MFLIRADMEVVIPSLCSNSRTCLIPADPWFPTDLCGCCLFEVPAFEVPDLARVDCAFFVCFLLGAMAICP